MRRGCSLFFFSCAPRPCLVPFSFRLNIERKTDCQQSTSGFAFTYHHHHRSNDTATDRDTSPTPITTATTLRRRRRRRRNIRYWRRNNHNIQLDTNSVINLSNVTLSHDETQLLARGLTFCPTPRQIDLNEVRADINEFSHACVYWNISTISLLRSTIILSTSKAPGHLLNIGTQLWTLSSVQ